MVTATLKGHDWNFFQQVVVTPATFPTDAQVFINMPRSVETFSLVNEGGSVVYYSFNGNTLHGTMTPGTPTAALFFDNRVVSKIFFCAPAGGSPSVRVEAWAGR